MISVNVLNTGRAEKEPVTGKIALLEERFSGGTLFAGGNQPARRSFGIGEVTAGSCSVPVRTRDVARSPFCALVEFSAACLPAPENLLIVAPLSGHFPLLARDLILGLLPHFRVYITDWSNVRHVPAQYGPLGLDGNISFVVDCVERLPAGLHVLGLCQGGVPALAATALLAARAETAAPASLTLIGAPIAPLANPTRVVKLLRSRPLSWFERNAIATVPEDYAGHERRVYPAHLHLLPLLLYLTRHIGEGTDTGAKALFDDGADPSRFPFADLYTSIMDLDAAYFLENTRDVFHDCLLPKGALRCKGARVVPAAIRSTALLTVEGERDDIAAPGQTAAAHGLASSLPARLRRQLIVPGAGHFSLFYGETWRRAVLPAIRSFCGTHTHTREAAARRMTAV